MERLLCFVLIVCFFLTGCAAGNSSENGTNIEQQISPGVDYTLGGTTQTGWQVEIPPDALDGDTLLTMNVLSQEASETYTSE